MIYCKEVPIKYETDVCVVGGGPAGIAAAISCARQGCSVFLLEAGGCFGGAATQALVPTFVTFTDGLNFLVGGVGKEIYDRCRAENPNCMTGRNVGYDVEKLKRMYDDMIAAAGVRFLFFANMVDAVATDGHVDSIIVSAKSGLYAIKAKLFVDATGDGDLCVRAGARFELGAEDGGIMGASLCSTWVNVDWSLPEPDQSSALERAFSDGVFTYEDRHLPGIYKQGASLGGGNITHVYGVDPTKEEDLTRGMIEGRRILPEFEAYYRQYVGGPFANAYPVATGAMLGIRESRRIIGDYKLTERDYDRRAVFDDEIGRYCYPIDVHESSPTKENYNAFMKDFTTRLYQDGESYGIPYRCLLPQNLQNVFVTGRCISADRKMMASTRVMPCCFLTGQAAGVAAALAVEAGEDDMRKVDVKDLQDRLAVLGVYLPNHR